MRMMLALALALTASSALADEVGDAHKLASQGRDSYWNCLAGEYSRPEAKGMSVQDFAADIAIACPSERQNFRVRLLDYLSLQFPSTDTGVHLTTVNPAIATAEKDVMTAFLRRKGATN